MLFDTTAPNILVVEDDPKLAGLLCRALTEDGLHVSCEHDGLVALQRLLDDDFDAVLLDIGLPQLSGLEVCFRLKAAGSRTRVLMLSARDGPDDVIAGRDAGAADYFIKPFSLAELTLRLRQVLATAEATSGGAVMRSPPLTAGR